MMKKKLKEDLQEKQSAYSEEFQKLVDTYYNSSMTENEMDEACLTLLSKYLAPRDEFSSWLAAHADYESATGHIYDDADYWESDNLLKSSAVEEARKAIEFDLAAAQAYKDFGYFRTAKTLEKEATELYNYFPGEVDESLNKKPANAKINIRESLNKYDLRTDNKYDLRNLYDSCIMTDKEKRIIAEMIAKNTRANVLYEALMNKFEGKSLTEAPDEYGIPYDDELEVEYDSIRKAAEKKIADRKAEVENERKKAYQPYYVYEGQQIPSKSSDYIKTIVAAVDIPDGAFQSLFGVEKLIIFPGVKSIGTELFTSSPVRLVYIPDSVENISKRAFKGIYNATFYCSAKSFAYDYLTKLDLDVDTNVRTLNQMLGESLKEAREYCVKPHKIDMDVYDIVFCDDHPHAGERASNKRFESEKEASAYIKKNWKQNNWFKGESLEEAADREIDRKGFKSLIKYGVRDDGGNYAILNDGYLVRKFWADNDDEAKEIFRKGPSRKPELTQDDMNAGQWYESLQESKPLKTLKEDLQLELVDSKEENEGSFSGQYYQYKIGRYNVEKTVRTRGGGRTYEYIEAIPEGETVIGKISYNSIRRDPHFLIESSHAVISDIEGIQKAIADYQEAIQVAEVLERELL